MLHEIGLDPFENNHESRDVLIETTHYRHVSDSHRITYAHQKFFLVNALCTDPKP
jgi:hypothetical protein